MFNFILYNKLKVIIISNHPIDKVKNKFGLGYEIINTVKEKQSVDVIKQRTIRSYPNCKFIKYYHKTWTLSSETKRKMSKAKKGKKVSEEVKAKISLKMKGKSNFEGKTHSEVSRRKTSMSSRNNKKVKGTFWIYSPSLNQEKRIRSLKEMPEGFILGRNYDSIEFSMR